MFLRFNCSLDYIFFHSADVAMTPKQFLVEEKKLKAEHEEEYKVYIDLPEMHPAYENTFGVFINQHFDRSKNQDSQWTSFWSKQVEDFKTKEWDEKKKLLVTRYRRALAAKKAATTAAASLEDKIVSPVVEQSCNAAVSLKSGEGSVNTGLENFNVRSAVSAIREIVGDIGYLGAALTAVLEVVEKHGFTTMEAFDVFEDTDNYTLMTLCTKKLEKLKPRTYVIHNAIEASKSLPEYCRITRKQMKAGREVDSGLDLPKIARDTMGYSTAQIVQRVKLELEKIGVYDLPQDKLNKIYMTYNSIQFNLALQNSETTTPRPTQPKASPSSRGQDILGESLGRVDKPPEPSSYWVAGTSSSNQYDRRPSVSTPKSSGYEQSYDSPKYSSDFTEKQQSNPPGSYQKESASRSSSTSSTSSSSRSSASSGQTKQPQQSVNSFSSAATHQQTPTSLYEVDRNGRGSWFHERVKSIVQKPNRTLHVFNSELASLMKDRPVNYKFTESDMRIVKDLQELGKKDLGETMFFSCLRQNLNI